MQCERNTTKNCLVFEEGRFWGGQLTYLLARHGVNVTSYSKLEVLAQDLGQDPDSILVFELSESNLLACVEFVCQLSEMARPIPAIIILPRSLRSCVRQLLGLGALYVALSRREFTSVAGLVERYLTSVTTRELTLAGSIHVSLPWTEQARRTAVE